MLESLGVGSVDLGASTCDVVLGGAESRGSPSPCVFSVRTYCGLTVVLLFCPVRNGVSGAGMMCHASYSLSP